MRPAYKPGGWVAIATPNRLRLDNRVRRALRRDRVPLRAMHFRELTCQELETMARSVSLRPIASFAYGLTLTIPRLGRQLVPPLAGIRIGSRVQALGTVICLIFQRAG